MAIVFSSDSASAAAMEIEDAVPVDDSLLLTISIAGFLVMGTSIYWIFFRERKDVDDDEDTTQQRGRRKHHNSRAARRAQAREERKHSDDGNHHDHRKQHKRRPFVPESSSGRQVDASTAAAAKRDRMALKRQQREEEAAAAFACFYGPVCIDELATQRVLDIEELSVACGASTEQVRQRIEALISTKRWAGFFQENDVGEVEDPSTTIKDDTTDEKTSKSRLHFIRIFDAELQLIADSIKARQRVTLSEVAEIIQRIVDGDGNPPENQ